MNNDLTKLFTCPRCQTPNFTKRDLASHVCKKNNRAPLPKQEIERVIAGSGQRPAGAVRELTLEVLDALPVSRRVGRAKPVTLEVIETQIRDLLNTDAVRELAWKNEAVYDRVAVGLCLLKGREIHLRQGQKAPSGTVSTSPRALAKAQEKADTGFIAWIEETFPGFTARTARNYMNGARNCGLTSDHGLEDVEALKTAQALHDKTAKELYALPDAERKPDDAEPPVQLDLFAETQGNLFVSLDEMLLLREDKDSTPERFEATTTRLHATLEKWTGASWIMAGSRNAEGGVRKAKSKRAKSKRAKKKGAKRQ